MSRLVGSQADVLAPAQTRAEDQPRSLFWSRQDGALHVQWYRANSDICFEPHTHSEYNIVVSLQGAVETSQLGFQQAIEAGEAMMGSNPGVQHSSRYLAARAGCEAVSVTFDPGMLRAVGARGVAVPGEIPAYLGKLPSAVAATAARAIVEEFRGKELGYGVVIEGLALRILVEALRAWPPGRMELVPADATPRLTRRDHVRASEFMRWCRKDEFRMQHLCRFLGASEERFTRLFKGSTGDSPASFYNRLLLERGCDLLRGNTLSVKEVSYELGFKTPSHFVVAFRRQFGRTPLDYRLSSGG